MKRKIIPKEIKDEVLAKVKSGERVSEVASLFGISTKTIYTWMSKGVGGESIVSLSKYNRLKRENEELKRLIGEVTLEMSLGKKN